MPYITHGLKPRPLWSATPLSGFLRSEVYEEIESSRELAENEKECRGTVRNIGVSAVREKL